MTGSRCLGNARTNRKGKVQVYLDEDLYEPVSELQGKKDPTQMLKYIENLTKHNNDFKKVCLLCGKVVYYEGKGRPICPDCQSKPIPKS